MDIQPKRKYSLTALRSPQEAGYPHGCTLFAPEKVLAFIEILPCVSAVIRFGSGAHIDINPLYDAQEAYHFIREQLESESGEVQLDDMWKVD